MTSQTAFFDERAEKWEETCYPPPVRKQLTALVPEFGVKTGERLLDLGTGPGILIPYLQVCAGPYGQILAIDISYRMIRQARKKIRNTGDIAIQANALQLPFKDKVFDRVICFAAFPHFNDPGRAVQEMGWVLRPGGTLVIAHLMSREELANHHAGHESVARDLLPDDQRMTMFFIEAMLSPPEIMNRPGLYMAKGLKNI